MLQVDEVDLLALARALRERLGPHLDEEYLAGRTILRDAVIAQLACSALQAEELVDTMEGSGYISFPQLVDTTHSCRSGRWTIHG